MAGKKNEKTKTVKKTTTKKVAVKKTEEVKKIDLDETRELASLREELKKELSKKNLTTVKNKKTSTKKVTTNVNNRKIIKEESILNKIVKAISMVVMSVLLLICAFLITYIGINKISQAKGKTPPLGLYTIISPSMTPKIRVYDVVFVVKTDPDKINIGDVISYYSTNDFFKGVPITHRVVEKLHTNEGIIFRTQGDANPKKDDEVIFSNNVVGVVKFKIPQLGRLQFFLSSKMGWIIAILIPSLGILSYDIVKLFKLITLRNQLLNSKKVIK